VALAVQDVERSERGLLVTVRRSKTDQEGRGQVRALLRGRSPETCPVRALDAWLEASGVSMGALFRALNRHGQVGERLTPRAVAQSTLPPLKGFASAWRAAMDACK
jgi:hypothetical protein